MDRKKGYSDYDPLEEYNDYEEENEAEDDYHRRTQQKVTKTEKSLKTVFGMIIAALVVLVILLIAVFGIKNKISKNKAEEETTVVDETKENGVETSYTPGVYSVTAAGSLRLREEHSMEGKQIMSVPSGTKLTISEIFCDEYAVTDEEKYWGKTDYKGNIAWVCLAYMTKENEAAVEETSTGDAAETSVAAETTAASAESTSTAPVSDTTAPVIENTTAYEAPTASSDSGTYATGNYTFTGTDSKLHMRDDHCVSANSIVDIPAGDIFNVTEIVADENASSDALKYWGHISYSGYDGWVCMSVLDAAQ